MSAGGCGPHVLPSASRKKNSLRPSASASSKFKNTKKASTASAPHELNAIAKFFDLPVSYFFAGIDKHRARAACDPGMCAIAEALSTKDGTRIALALAGIQNPKMRRRITSLLETIIRRR